MTKDETWCAKIKSYIGLVEENLSAVPFRSLLGVRQSQGLSHRQSQEAISPAKALKMNTEFVGVISYEGVQICTLSVHSTGQVGK